MRKSPSVATSVRHHRASRWHPTITNTEVILRPDLIDGQDSRNIGDYDIGPGISESEAAEQIERADKFVELAQSKLGTPRDESAEDS